MLLKLCLGASLLGELSAGTIQNAIQMNKYTKYLGFHTSHLVTVSYKMLLENNSLRVEISVSLNRLLVSYVATKMKIWLNVTWVHFCWSGHKYVHTVMTVIIFH